ncbi:MAG: hypothetical protein K9G67_11120 [Bacteroidales bacterium]|nr:hypothetical protein [Bacteroidales bacterium]MCF8345135.1 hypothetical protein [Bacteroidales bacterium]MCF8351309.1 hypothetical protein [Bacteroidales bacterium]MCF8376897.1 hypothetical protein [Bacteroidales bacterium]MCF8400834.1 hypothetical protein [Bacteroidales bacterium]
MIIKILESLRIVGVISGYFIAYFTTDSPAEILHILTIWMIVSVAGLSGIEGLFFPDQAAKEKGFETGSNYQRQTAFFFLSMAIMSVIVFILKWGAAAEITLSLTFLIFMLFSGINHGWQSVAHRNFKWNNVIRPFQTLFLIAIFLYPLIKLL